MRSYDRARPVQMLALLSVAIFIASPALAQEVSPFTRVTYQVPAISLAQTPGPSGVTALSATNAFIDWLRYPAEERAWLPMVERTAYFRDVLTAGKTFISGPMDGDTWTAEARSPAPDNTLLRWQTITFHSLFNGNQNCFVSASWEICNITNLYVIWEMRSQCQQPGTWTMSFYNNGTNFYTGEYTILPRIAPGKVAPINQGDYGDAKLYPYDTACRTTTCTTMNCDYLCDGRPGEVKVSIKQEGCYLTDAAMILNYHRVSVDPPTLDVWLNNYKDSKGRPKGYSPIGRINPFAIAAYARGRGVRMSYPAPAPPAQEVWAGLDELEQYACYYGPQIISVGFPHWVTAIGATADRATWTAIDPSGGRERQYTAYYDWREYGGPDYLYTDISGIRIVFHSPGELLLTDPQGRRIGYDPTTGVAYNEVPGAYYKDVGQDDDETGEVSPMITKELVAPRPPAGDYRLQVTGTGTGTYTLDIQAYDPDLNLSTEPFEDMPITPGQVHVYAFHFAKTVGTEIEVFGTFDGGGQRPRDVNKFLTYSSPTASRTALPAGTTTYPVIIFYGQTILPTSFRAELNGADISTWFHPTPGGHELISLPVQPGRNVVVLSVDGNLPNRVATDTDRLVLLVP